MTLHQNSSARMAESSPSAFYTGVRIARHAAEHIQGLAIVRNGLVVLAHRLKRFTSFFDQGNTQFLAQLIDAKEWSWARCPANQLAVCEYLLDPDLTLSYEPQYQAS